MYRPKHFVMYLYGEIYQAHIVCHPQSRWELVYEKHNKIALRNKHTSIELTREDFEKHWVEVLKDGNI